MTIRLQEVMRSEVEGGLSGPANPIPSQSIDCGCGQMQCPKLAKFATRKLYLGLICCVGVLQAASLAYFHVTGSTIARRFQIDPYFMDWILVVSELTPLFLGVAIAYWGDRIHRASWIGALTLLQSVSYFLLIIPHLTHRLRVVEETPNVTHMSLYSDDSPELCTLGTSKIITDDDEPCYFTMFILIVVLMITGMANVAYYALGISYLDDNTKKRHVAAFIGVIVAVKIVGILPGYLLGWGCLRIDAESLNIVESYRDQIGAWWLGFPILAVLLLIPGLLISWFPRRLPSEVVEQAAASLLDRAALHNRAPHRAANRKVGSPDFWPSLCRLITNKILICNILASAFCATALLNFMAHEDMFLESRFYIARPKGMFLGFSDPLLSRLVITIVKPVLIGLIVIMSGLVLAKARPQARIIVGYSFIVVFLTVATIACLIFATCDKRPIVGIDKSSVALLKFCNKNCRCSKDAVFRPVCDTLRTFTYYNPCYAGCGTIIHVDNVKIYSGCSCVEDMTGWGNDQAKDGPCDSMKCQFGWMFFEFGTLFAYALVSSTLVGDLLINIRSVYKQDKAIGIGFWMMWIAMFVYILGRILYQLISYHTCLHWGSGKTICHLHDDEKLGDYLCYLTTLFLLLCLLFKIVVWFLCKNLQLYENIESRIQKVPEIRELIQQVPTSEQTNNEATRQVEIIIEPESRILSHETAPEENPPKDEEGDQRSAPLKYGPLGPGDRRTTSSKLTTSHNSQSTIGNLDSGDELDSSSDESKKQSSGLQVAYTPLELDSDVESDLSSTGPRSRRRISSKDYDTANENDRPSSKNSSIRRRFPNPDHYEDPRKVRSSKSRNPNGYLDGSSKASSFEFSQKGQESDALKRGDFNEVGIPIVDPFPGGKGDVTNATYLKDVKSLIDRFEQNASQETLEDEDRLSVKSAGDTRRGRSENKLGIPLVAMIPGRSSSRGRSTSGFGSLPDVQDKSFDVRSEKRAIPDSSKDSAKRSKPAHCTDL